MNSVSLDLLTRYYHALESKDPEGMADCYHKDAIFMDPVFGRLKRDEACAMWKMLLGRAGDLKVSYQILHADEASGSGHWIARYTFSKTGRKVVNAIDSQFGFLEGKIMAHRDRFDLWRWSRQALGLSGLLLGWTPYLQKRVRAQARESLDAFMKKAK